MIGRYSEHVRRLREAVFGSGRTEPALRRAIEARAAVLGGRAAAAGEVPERLRAFVDTVAVNAYRVTPEDVEGLRRDGWSEDEIFEITASAALGAGLGRLERGMAALRGEV